jgi:DNA-binding MarR family transcriptional regulator
MNHASRPNFATDSDVAGRIGFAWRELRRGTAITTVREQLFGIGGDALDPGQMDTLDLLVERDQWRMCDLADAMHVEPSTATRAIQRLVASGLAERAQSSRDGRVVLVTATGAGRARHSAVMQARLNFLRDLIEQWSPEEADQIAQALETLIAGIDVAVVKLQEKSNNG